MIYEVEIFFRSLRRDGIKGVSMRLGQYFRQRVLGVYFGFLRLPENAPTEQVINFGFNAAGGLLKVQQVPSEILRLCELFRQRQPKTIVEIGTAHGGSLFLWSRLAPADATIVSIDLPGGIHGGGYPPWKTRLFKRFPLPTQTLHLFCGDSHQPAMLARLKAVLPGDGKIDYLFIDGDHTYGGVKADFELYSGLVRPGGLIVFHDICKHPDELNCQVDRFWQEVKNGRRVREFVEDFNQGRFGIGVIEV
jgi:predicted O-methyltransferase YrrM